MLVSQSWSVHLRLSVFWVDGRVVGPSYSLSLGQTWEMVFHRHETEVRGHSSPNSHCVCVFLYFDISNCNCDVIGEREGANLVVQLAPFLQAVHAGCQRVHAGCQRVHAVCQCVRAGCQFSPTSWCGSVRTVLMLTGERLCQNRTK